MSSLSAPVQATVVDNLHSELAPDPLAFLVSFPALCCVRVFHSLTGWVFLLESEFRKERKSKDAFHLCQSSMSELPKKRMKSLKKIDAGSYFERMNWERVALS